MYKELVNEKDSLFDMATSDPIRIKVCVEKWGVKMSETGPDLDCRGPWATSLGGPPPIPPQLIIY